jgi:uncharacterized circularly permuted ATP-grasp superfamily protein
MQLQADVLDTKYIYKYVPRILKNFLHAQYLNEQFIFHISN